MMKSTPLLTISLLLLVGAPGVRAAGPPPPSEETEAAGTPSPDPADPQQRRAPKRPPKTRVEPPTRKPAADKARDTKAATAKKTPPKYTPSFEPGAVRIKDIADVQGVRGNQLVGYGLIVGLEGTGDGQQSLFTVQSTLNMLRSFGVTLNITPQQLQLKNVAAVMVTAELPAFAKQGSHIDVTVSSLGDAKSLQGGLLLQTPLRGANGEVYAVAQGAVSIGGFNFSAGGASVQRNHTTVGRVPRGAYVEQEVPTTITDGNSVQITLREPDFTTASRVVDALHKEKYDAQALDAATVSITVPKELGRNLIGFLSQVEVLSVVPDIQARIVINERTGTVVVGGNVRLAPGSVAHGSISIVVENNPIVVPPAPFNPNPGQVVNNQDVKVTEKTAKFAPIPATTTIEQLVSTLNRLGVTPRDLISILQGMRSAGMVNAVIEVQ